MYTIHDKLKTRPHEWVEDATKETCTQCNNIFAESCKNGYEMRTNAVAVETEATAVTLAIVIAIIIIISMAITN